MPSVENDAPAWEPRDGLRHCLNPGCIDYQCERDKPKCPGEVCASCDDIWDEREDEASVIPPTGGPDLRDSIGSAHKRLRGDFR